MTIAIHESALIRHFNTRKETLRAWEEKVGCKFSPFRGFKMPDSRLYVEHPEFLDSIVDLVLTNERHIFIRGPVGSGKSEPKNRPGSSSSACPAIARSRGFSSCRWA